MADDSSRVLIVDDEDSLRLTLSALLEMEGFQVVTANSALKALELLRQSPPKVVISDIRMPGMSGVELFRAIQRESGDVRVILMTAFAQEKLIEEAMSGGAFAVLKKPLDLDHLLTVIQGAISHPSVLVVSPDPAEVELTLSEARVPALVARTPTEALDRLRRETVDVCVVDLAWPDRTGPEVIRDLRRISPRVRVLGVGPDGADVNGATAEGASACLRLPDQLERLAWFVANVRGAPLKIA